MSLVPTATSDTMTGPFAPDKSPKQNLDFYQQAHQDTAQLKVKGYIEEVPADMRANSESMPAGPAPATRYGGGRKKAQKKSWNGMRFPKDGDDEGPFKQIGRGFLTVITTPIALAGMSIYAVGVIVEGGGTMLKGIGSLGRYVFVPPRPKRRNNAGFHEDV